MYNAPWVCWRACGCTSWWALDTVDTMTHEIPDATPFLLFPMPTKTFWVVCCVLCCPYSAP
jgi:hypothetical protein